jgi:hypothetical protein
MTVESIHPDAPLAIHSVGSLVFDRVFDQQKPRGKRGFFGSQMAKIDGFVCFVLMNFDLMTWTIFSSF